MKKTILTILLCGVMVLGMTGCGKQKNEFDIGNKSDIKISQNDVIMTIKEGTLTNKSATLVLTNNSDKNFQYGNPYEIEIKKDGEWHKINVELNFTMPAFQLSARENKEIEINWENGKNLPDLSLYNDICKILNITTNELINGMDLKNNLDIKKLIPSLISLTIIILVFIINSKSIFSFILILISLIIILFNLNKITNKKVTIISFVSLVIFLNFIDYLNVQINNELPVLKYSIKNNISTSIYKTLSFKVINCNRYENEPLHIVSLFKSDKKYCTNLSRLEVNSILNKLDNIEGITLAIRVFDGEKNDKQYVTTTVPGTYEIVKTITDKEILKNITDILKTGEYVENSNAIGYNHLLQIYTKNETIDFEFNEIHYGNTKYNYNLTENSMDKLKEYFK